MPFEVQLNTDQIAMYCKKTRDINPPHVNENASVDLQRSWGAQEEGIERGLIFPGALLPLLLENNQSPIKDHYILGFGDSQRKYKRELKDPSKDQLKYGSFLVVNKKEPKTIICDLSLRLKEPSMFWYKFKIMEKGKTYTKDEELPLSGDIFTTDNKELFELTAKERSSKNFDKYSDVDKLLEKKLEGEIIIRKKVEIGREEIIDWCNCMGIDLSLYFKKYGEMPSGMIADLYIPSLIINGAQKFEEQYIYLGHQLDVFSRKFKDNVLDFYGKISRPKKTGVQANFSVKSLDELLMGSRLVTMSNHA